MYVKKCGKNENYRLIKAEDIVGKKVKYLNNAMFDQKDYYFELLDRCDLENNIDMNKWLEFFGSWINTSQDSEIFEDFIVNSREEYICMPYDESFINSAIKTLKFDFTLDDELYQYLKIIDLKKGLPNWIWNLSQRQCRLLLSHMTHFLTLVSKLEDDFQRLLLHAGYARNHRLQYTKGILKFDEINEHIFDASMYKSHIEEIYDYKGPVFCLQVPSEIFYVRRNGIPVWTGNSRSTGPYQLLTKQPAEGRSRSGKQICRKSSVKTLIVFVTESNTIKFRESLVKLYYQIMIIIL
jgi:hypothetical protein